MNTQNAKKTKHISLRIKMLACKARLYVYIISYLHLLVNSFSTSCTFFVNTFLRIVTLQCKSYETVRYKLRCILSARQIYFNSHIKHLRGALKAVSMAVKTPLKHFIEKE